MYTNPLAIRTKIQQSFSELQEKFDPELLYQALIDICNLAVKLPQVVTDIGLLGPDGLTLQNMSIEGIPLGTTIIVLYEGAVLPYTLTNQVTDYAIEPYFIESYYSTVEAPRTWVRSGVMLYEVDAADLNESHSLEVAHNLGLPILAVTAFTSTGALVPGVVWEPSNIDPDTQLMITFPSGFEGTRNVMVMY